MNRCFELAQNGLGKVAPNPMVGCVIVKDGAIIGEGYHEKYGENHAEVNAIESVENAELLRGAEMYVNLEPCTHHGKTPPCVDRILEAGIGKVIIADSDPSEKVHGKGIEKLRTNGVLVETSVLLEEEHRINKRFRTYHEKKRPYIILKWAQTVDRFIDIDRAHGEKGQIKISNEACKRLLHKWRSEEQSIMVGTTTALNDDPSLNVRLVEGSNPLRVVLDRYNRLPQELKMFNDGNKTLLYSYHEGADVNNVERVILDGSSNILGKIMDDLYQREIQSLIVEGGRYLFTSFISQNLWDEIRIFQSQDELKTGLPAPELTQKEDSRLELDDNTYFLYLNKK